MPSPMRKNSTTPDIIIDLATLTGACIAALGYSVAGLFSNSDRLAEDICEAGQRTGRKYGACRSGKSMTK